MLLSSILDWIKCMVASENCIQILSRLVDPPWSVGESALLSKPLERMESLVTNEKDISNSTEIGVISAVLQCSCAVIIGPRPARKYDCQ
jgi:hypothetical protein